MKDDQWMMKISNRFSFVFWIFHVKIPLKNQNSVKTTSIEVVLWADRSNFSIPIEQDQNELPRFRRTRDIRKKSFYVHFFEQVHAKSCRKLNFSNILSSSEPMELVLVLFNSYWKILSISPQENLDTGHFNKILIFQRYFDVKRPKYEQKPTWNFHHIILIIFHIPFMQFFQNCSSYPSLTASFWRFNQSGRALKKRNSRKLMRLKTGNFV